MKRGSGAKSRAIKAWLLSGRPLTQLEATEKFGCLRLPTIIFDMRKAGVAVKTIMVENDDGSQYARYIVEHHETGRQLSLF